MRVQSPERGRSAVHVPMHCSSRAIGVSSLPDPLGRPQGGVQPWRLPDGQRHKLEGPGKWGRKAAGEAGPAQPPPRPPHQIAAQTHPTTIFPTLRNAQVFPRMRNYTAAHKMTGVGNALKRHYQMFLLEYEHVSSPLFSSVPLFC